MLRDLRNHPDVKSGRKTEDQVKTDYTELLDFHHEAIVIILLLHTFLNNTGRIKYFICYAKGV